MDDQIISYLLSARRRVTILSLLATSSCTAVEISELTFINYQYVLTKLQELYNKGLITHNNAKRSKIYSITPVGREAIKEIQKQGRDFNAN